MRLLLADRRVDSFLVRGSIMDILKGGNLVTGVAIGIGAGVLAPVVTPVLRPLAKSLIKAGLIAFDQGRAALADLNEKTSDMVAEAREEMRNGGASAPAAEENA